MNVKLDRYINNVLFGNAEERTLVHYGKPHNSRKYDHPVIKAFAKPKVEWILSKINLKNKKVLEVGGGNGYFSSQLMNLCNLTVLDISENELALNPAVHKVVGDAYKLPFINNIFDIVFSSNLLHHLNNPQKAVYEMARVSRRFVVVNEPNRNNPLTFFGSFLLTAERLAIKFSRKYLISLVNKANLKVLHSTYIGGLVMPNGTPERLLLFARPDSRNSFSFFQMLICEKRN